MIEKVDLDYTFLTGIFGNGDEHLRGIEDYFKVTLKGRGSPLAIEGDRDSVGRVKNMLGQLNSLHQQGVVFNENDIRFVFRLFEDDRDVNAVEIFSKKNQVVTEKSIVTPNGISQKEFCYALARYDMVFGIGPAGTGKTYLSVAMGVSFLMQKRVSRIILARPAIEAGEKLGFLPGDMYEKVDPYMRPLYDALYDMMEVERVSQLIERGSIEIAPLGFMRGRTLNDSFVILDEAQNTTSEQMKMFLTRLGYNSKAIITGDITQIDLPDPEDSGLAAAKSVLENIAGIRFVHFSDRDVVRHDLVQAVIRAYGRKISMKNKNIPDS